MSMNQQQKLATIKNWLGSGSINIFGIQFSGKDTVGRNLAGLLAAEFMSSGDVVRAARHESANQQIQAAADVSDTGVLTPTEEFKQLIVPYLYDKKLRGKALILSSVGRWIGEEEPVMAALKRGEHDLRAVVLLDISETEGWQRWRAANNIKDRNVGRADESAARLETRLGEFRRKTLPVIAKYRRLGLVIDINAQQTREEVMNEVIEKLFQRAA
jgi:adenylate kinase family enzyme